MGKDKVIRDPKNSEDPFIKMCLRIAHGKNSSPESQQIDVLGRDNGTKIADLIDEIAKRKK